MHRDSLGTVQPIRPGAVNWMTAGSGIAHSERTPPELRAQGFNLFGIQSWVALPSHARGRRHRPSSTIAASDLPIIDGRGKTFALIAGSLYGEASPVETLDRDASTPTRFLNSGARIPLPAEHEERAVYVVAGRKSRSPATASSRDNFSSSVQATRSLSRR